MTTTATKPKRGRRQRETTLPCAKCGDPGGQIRRHAGCLTPARYDGTRFRIKGDICAKCRLACERKFGPVLTERPCDLCGVPCLKRYPGKPYDIEGEVCSTCRCELAEERNAANRRQRILDRMAKTAAKAIPSRRENEWSLDQRAIEAARLHLLAGLRLPVLNLPFTRNDLTPRAEARLVIREARARKKVSA